jgi:hypothetical protein
VRVEGWTSFLGQFLWGIPGTGKVASTETDWHEKIMLLARHAETIVIVPFNFAGTIWELEWLHHNGMLPKCVFVMPATTGGARNHEEAWKDASRFLTSIGIHAPEYERSGKLFYLDEGTVRSLRSFVEAPVPRATALRIQFALLQRRARRRREQVAAMSRD